MTTGPITLIGQDLAFTYNQTHAESNKNFKILTEREIKSKGFIKAEGYNGDEVLTDYSFMAMKQSFEFLIKNDFNDRLIFNSTEGGIKLEGFVQIPFGDFCEKYTDEKIKINNKFNKNKDKNIDYELLIKNFSKELENLDTIEVILRKNLKLMSKNTLKTKFNNDILKKWSVTMKKS